MKFNLKIFLMLLVLVAATPFLWWYLTPERGLKVLVVDKTVPLPDYREHSSLAWALGHLKTHPPRGERPWEPGIDYLGYHPNPADPRQPGKIELVDPKALAGVDLLFLADSYGVYQGDLEDLAEMKPALDFSSLIHGGFTLEEARAVEDFVRRGGNLVAEFNTFASPTSGEARATLERVIGVRWTGWAGRFFSELTPGGELPLWAPRLWKNQTGQDWAFTGPGYLLVHEDERLVVLRPDKELAEDRILIEAEATGSNLMDGVDTGVGFGFWFDVVDPAAETDVLASYRFHLTEEGRNLLKANQIPERFPCVTRTTAPPLRVYLAGDFSDNDFDRGPYYLSGWPLLQSLMTRGESDEVGMRSFFWRFYLPLMKNVLNALDQA